MVFQSLNQSKRKRSHDDLSFISGPRRDGHFFIHSVDVTQIRGIQMITYKDLSWQLKVGVVMGWLTLFVWILAFVAEYIAA